MNLNMIKKNFVLTVHPNAATTLPANAILRHPMHAMRQLQNACPYAPYATASLFSFAFNPDKSACPSC